MTDDDGDKHDSVRMQSGKINTYLAFRLERI